MNNKYEITAKDPLLRPGLTIKTIVSEKYAIKGLQKMMEIIQAFNEIESSREE